MSGRSKIAFIGKAGEISTRRKLSGWDFIPIRWIWFMPSPHAGGIVVTRTAGSGKSTTVRNILMDMNARENYRLKIYTFEDPPEYKIPLTVQIPVQRHAADQPNESPFLRPIRACMKGDPDILMIGEIRDRFAADGFKKATQSCCLVLSTIHASSALGIVDRLKDFGFQTPSLVLWNFLRYLFTKSCCRSCVRGVPRFWIHMQKIPSSIA
jgi:hypothetical protein